MQTRCWCGAGGSSKKHRATVETVANKCDLAVLLIEHETFWRTPTDYDDEEEEEVENDDRNNDENTHDGVLSAQEDKGKDAILPLEFGKLPELQDEVGVAAPTTAKSFKPNSMLLC
jgi:hypothetical protein